ncbi:MAG: Trk system potassium transporter TrkA [Clostridiales bacterium]|nr:Trk system potassium transporter TrkA [Clostridiales bacterium]
MQIIIVGCGKIGNSITQKLSQEGHNVTVIDLDNSIVQTTSTQYDVMGVIGNGASYSVQQEAGIAETDLLIAVTASDEVNLLCCLIAKKAGNCSTIARVRNPIYNAELSFIKEELGLSMSINPEFSAATEIARLLRFPSAIKIDTFAKGRVELLKFRIPDNSPLNQCTISNISKNIGCDILICAIERGDEVITPNGNTTLYAKDLVSFVASPQNASRFFKKIKIETHQVHNTIIVGGGKIAFYLAEQLIRSGISVKIIEKNLARCELLTEQLPSATIINGDATNQELLLEEGLAHSESFVSLTDMDEENIVLSLFAKKSSKAKVITKVNKISFDNVIRDFDLGSLVHPKQIVADNITSYVRAMQNSIGSNIETLYNIIDNKAEALEFIIRKNSPVIGIPLEKLNIRDHILVACITRKKSIIIPRGKDMIQEGDTVIIVTTHTGLHDIKDILKD